MGHRIRGWVGVPLALLAALVVAPAASAATGDLAFHSCFTQVSPPAGCTADAHLLQNTSAAYTPDGSEVYVASPNGHAASPLGMIAIYSRGSDGTLTPAGCVNGTGTGGCAAVTGLEHPYAIAVSADGQSVFVADLGSAAGRGGLFTLHRSAGGTLARTGCAVAQVLTGCTTDAAVASASALELAPDGTSVYLLSGSALHPSDPVNLNGFSLAGGSPAPAACVGSTAPCTPMLLPSGLLSLGGAGASGTLFITSTAVSAFSRGPGGTLAYTGCYGSFGGCTSVPNFPAGGFFVGATTSPDGAVLYLVGDNNTSGGYGEVAAYAIASGPPTLLSCLVGSTAPAVSGCTNSPDSPLYVIGPPAFSPDGANLYIGGEDGFEITLRRDANGALTELRCQDLFDPGASSCVLPASFNGVGVTTPSPDGAQLLVSYSNYSSALDGQLSVLSRAEPPSVNGAAATAATRTTATIAARANPHGGAGTMVTVRYGTTSAYGSSTVIPIGIDYRTVPISSTLTGLAPHTTYHYSSHISNANGGADTPDATFTTAAAGPPPPGAQRLSHLQISPSRLHLLAHRHGRRQTTMARVTYRQTLAGRTSLTVERQVTGIRSGRRCVPPTRHPRRSPRHCTRLIVVERLSHTGRVGAQTLRVASGHGIGVGHYIIVVAAGRATHSLSGTFTVSD